MAGVDLQVYDCCSESAQATCCEPSDKAKCCGPESSRCGCSAGEAAGDESRDEPGRAANRAQSG